MTGNYYTVIKRFADNYYSVTQLNRDKPRGVVRKPDWLTETSAYEEYLKKELPDVYKEQEESKSTNKLRESISRARTVIFEKAMCNEWDWFATFTIDPKKYDRYHLADFYTDFVQYLRDLRKRHDMDIKYLFIPEMHEDGAWHLHGVISGLPRQCLRLFTLKEKLPHYIRDKLKEGGKVYDWLSYHHRFGFCDLEPIRNVEACCKYIVKYITKDLERTVSEAYANTYYCSKGLQRAQIIYSGEDAERIALPHCSTVYMDRKSFFTYADAFEYANIQFYSSFIDAGLDERTIEQVVSGF